MTNTPRGDLLRFAGKAFLLGLPLLVCLGVIVLDDPFKVIWPHEFGDYYNDQPFELNRDYVSTELLLKHYRQEGYDTFIFGSSRSFSYHCDELLRLLPDSHPFHYPAASENLYGVYRKVKFLDRLGVPLRRVLLVLDYWALSDVTSRQDHLHMLHPAVSGEGRLHFQAAFLKACFSDLFIVKYIDYRLFGRIRPYMRGMFMIYPGQFRIEPAANDFFFEAYERALASDPGGYYRTHKHLFPRGRPPLVSDPAIKAVQRRYLEEMQAVFARHGTDCRIVINPQYDYPALNGRDLQALQEIFGRDRVFDYSGVNRFTENQSNFYDFAHYRPFVANAILREVYGRPPEQPPGAGAD
jgi:hypothetical protein